MRLASAAAYFDEQVLTDAYGTAMVKGQFDVFDDTKRDGPATRRRILSTAPAVTMPARKALKMDNITWLVGSSNPDYYKAVPIRRKHILHQADGLARVQTFAQFLSNAAPWTLDSGLPTLDAVTTTMDNGGVSEGLLAYAAIEWVKASKEVDESSDLSDLMTAIFATSESLPAVGIATIGGVAYLIREPHLSSAGFKIVYADEIAQPVTEQGTFTNRTYDPVADTWAEAGSSTRFLRLRWQAHFEYLSSRTLKFEAGDDVLMCLKTAATPKPNDNITLSDGTWQTLTVQSEGDCWSIHARRIQI